MTSGPAEPPTEYLTVEQIATELGVHRETAQRFFRDHGLPGRKIGHSWRTTRTAFDTWLTTAPTTDRGFGPEPTTTSPLETK